MNKLKLFYCENSSLGDSISKYLGIGPGEIFFHTFPRGEFYVQFKENIRGMDVFLLMSDNSPNDALMQLLIMADAARRASANRITAILPIFPYQRQDRKDKPRVPITSKLTMDLLAASGIDRIITMDLHAQQLQGFTNLPFDHLYFSPSLANTLKTENVDIDVVVAPDLGGVKKAVEYAEKYNHEFAFFTKKRKGDTDVEVTQFIGDVNGKNVLILDDLTESAGTLLEAAKECKSQGATNIYCAVTHGTLTPLGGERLQFAFEDGIINKFYCSNTITERWTNRTWANIINVGDVFAKAILGIHNNTSITSLFN